MLSYLKTRDLMLSYNYYMSTLIQPFTLGEQEPTQGGRGNERQQGGRGQGGRGQGGRGQGGRGQGGRGQGGRGQGGRGQELQGGRGQELQGGRGTYF